MRNISFSLTTPQIRARTKDVTRRLNWLHVKVGDRLMACEKCMGRKPGQPLVRLGVIEVVAVRREPLNRLLAGTRYAKREIVREGFPWMNARQFVNLFCTSHKRCRLRTAITRIEFRYV